MSSSSFLTLPMKPPMKMDSLYNFSAPLLNCSDILELSSLKHKIVLVVNIGVEDPSLEKEIQHLEHLSDKFSDDGLVIIVFPSTQFSPQENYSERAIDQKLEEMNIRHSMVVFAPVCVNGNEAHPLYKYLTHTIPMPADDPISFFPDPEKINWQPVLRSDIAGNFEKFLILPNGRPYKRYSGNFSSSNLSLDIKMLIHTLSHLRRKEKSGVKYKLK